MARMLLVISGEMGSGKGTVAQYLEDIFEFSVLRMSDILRDVLERLHLKQTRENMSVLSTMLRENFGEDVFARAIVEDVEMKKGNVVIEGIGRKSGIQYLQEVEGFHLIYVEASLETRYKRLVSRTENVGDANKTWEEFQREHILEAESQVSELRSLAEYVITNDGDKDCLYQDLDKMMDKLLREKQERGEGELKMRR